MSDKSVARAITIRDIALLMEIELQRATDLYGPFNSSHEGYAILKEEYEELGEVLERLWACVKKNDIEQAIIEAIQLGAMTMRFVHDLGGLPCTTETK